MPAQFLCQIINVVGYLLSHFSLNISNSKRAASSDGAEYMDLGLQ